MTWNLQVMEFDRNRFHEIHFWPWSNTLTHTPIRRLQSAIRRSTYHQNNSMKSTTVMVIPEKLST